MHKFSWQFNFVRNQLWLASNFCARSDEHRWNVMDLQKGRPRFFILLGRCQVIVWKSAAAVVQYARPVKSPGNCNPATFGEALSSIPSASKAHASVQSASARVHEQRQWRDIWKKTGIFFSNFEVKCQNKYWISSARFVSVCANKVRMIEMMHPKYWAMRKINQWRVITTK